MKSWKARLLMGLMLVATLLTMAVGPAMAHDNDFNRQDCCDDRQDFRHDLRDDFFFNHDFNDCDFHDCDFDDNDFVDFGFFPFFDDFGFVNDCAFAGDFEGPVNQFDCFD